MANNDPTAEGVFMCTEIGTMKDTRGIWIGENPLDFVLPVFMMQLSYATSVTGTVKFLLEPFGQSSFVSQMIGGIFGGPSGLGQAYLLREYIFSQKNLHIFETFQYFGCMFFLFLVGVKMDPTMVTKSGKKAWFIGLSCYLVPLILTVSVSHIITRTVQMDPFFSKSLQSAAGLVSLTSFHSIACLLEDLKLLNSELGRLAMSSSMISGCCSFFTAFLGFSYKHSMVINKPHSFIWIMLSCCTMILFIVYFIRPILLWMIRNTPDGSNVKESYIFSIFIMVLVSSFLGEVVGQHFLAGPMILGLVVPVGPPLGAAIEEKLDCFVSCILMPIYILANGGRINFHDLNTGHFALTQFTVLFSFLGKLLGAMLPALYCKMPYQDAILLGLIMNAHGVLDIQVCRRANTLGALSYDMFRMLLLSMVIITGIISPIIRAMYDPSTRYLPYKRRTIQHMKGNMEFRILACVYLEENVPSIINILEASHPTRYSPIGVYIVHLVQLQGRATPLLIAHKNSKNVQSRFNPSTHIVNAFRLYEKHYEGIATVTSFTAVSPYSTMHDDICSLGLDKRTTIIIIPFHKQQSLGSVDHSVAGVRKVSRNVLQKSPCSVGILVDRETHTSSATIYSGKVQYKVGVIFLGGADDREALAFGARMSEHYTVYLKVVRFILSTNKKQESGSVSSADKRLDNDAIADFRTNSAGNDHVTYREEEVEDGIAMVSAIRSVDEKLDLIMVGKQQGKDSSGLFRGIAEWSEFPELGIIGDLLATSGSSARGSVLVVQQQAKISPELLMDSPRHSYA